MTMIGPDERRIETIAGKFALLPFLLLLLIAMISGCGDASAPVTDDTTDISGFTADTEASAAVETTSAQPSPDSPYDLQNVLLVESVADSSEMSPYRYITWEGLDISRLLEYGFGLYGSYEDKYYVVNVFRRNGEYFFSDYLFEGKSYTEWSDEVLMASHKVSLVKQLLEREGEILKYGKEVITVTGIPTDDPTIYEFQKGVRWAESLYDQTVAKYNECDPEMLTRYIVDGDFLSELAESDLPLLEAEYKALKKKQYEMFDYFFQRHAPDDLALFESLGFKTDEINGKLYIFATIDQLRTLSGVGDMSAFSFTPLPRDDYLDAYPVSKLPDDYKLDRTVSGFVLDKFLFENLRVENERSVNVYVSTDEEFYCALDETIHRYKRGDLYIELRFFAISDKGNRYCIDISKLEGLKYSGYYVSKYSFLTAVKLRFEDFNDPEIMECLRDLSLREEITLIIITHRMYVG